MSLRLNISYTLGTSGKKHPSASPLLTGKKNLPYSLAWVSTKHWPPKWVPPPSPKQKKMPALSYVVTSFASIHLLVVMLYCDIWHVRSSRELLDTNNNKGTQSNLVEHGP